MNSTTPTDGSRPSAIHLNQFTAAKLLTLGALGLLLYVAHQAFIPIALALLAALVLSGPVETLLKFRIPRSLSATVILIVFLAAWQWAPGLFGIPPFIIPSASTVWERFLEMMARDNGTAVGLATAQSATVARISEWAKKVEGRGFVLVPVTMVAIKAKSS